MHHDQSHGDAARETEGADVVVRTFLIADVRGYTRFTQAHGDEEAGKLAASFAALARDVVVSMGGELVELRGDEALSAFGSARQALRAAVEMQARFRERVDGRPVFPLGIGIGLAAGEAVPVEGGYRGGALNLAARLCSIAAPGQILASDTVTSLAGRLEGVRFVERRGLRLKGLESRVRPFEVVPEAELPPVPEAPTPTRRSRRTPVLSAVGVALVAVLVAVALALTSDSEPPAIGNAIAAVGADGSVSYTEAGTTPSTIAIGEGAVWVLNADDRTISKIDPETKSVRTFGTGGTPTDLAVGAGAVWVGSGEESGHAIGNVFTRRVSRLDPQSMTPTGTATLTGDPSPGGANAGQLRLTGVSQLTAGAGAVWAINPDLSVSRIDAETGEVVARIPVEAGGAIAAGQEGVWMIGDEGVIRIDRRRNVSGGEIELPAEFLWGLAVGGGAVWVTDLVTGVLWRIDAVPDPVPRPIDLGLGITSVAYGADAVWVTNFVTDEVLRIDPETHDVTARLALAGTPPSVAADAEKAWISIAGDPSRDVLPASVCSRVVSEGGEPDVLIASDLPLQGPSGAITRTAANAIGFVLRKHGFRAGPHTVGYQSCDDSTSQAGGFDLVKCASNGKVYAATPRVVGVIGPWTSPCAWMQIPITSSAREALALVSPSASHPGLTHRAPGGGSDEPGEYYPTGVRNFFRVSGSSDLDGAAGATLADELELDRVYVLSSDGLGEETATPFRQAAKRLGITIAGSAGWDSSSSDYRALAARVATARPDGVYIGDGLFANGGEVVKALRARLGRKVVLIAGDSFQPTEELLAAAGPAAIGMYVTTTAIAHEGLSDEGRRFLRGFRRTQPGGVAPSVLYVTEAAQAAEVLLEAIARSDGTRASVLGELRGLEMEDGLVGSFRFDANGDITPAAFTVLRITGSPERARDLPEGLGGAVVDRVVRVAPELGQP
ncbi:MAG TPA: ABC transporter substrate-binding protein [Gaiellaceae bacterium]|nr:ABC transporter substrate-binding protein [Gaiellaceae bacterium]